MIKKVKLYSEAQGKCVDFDVKFNKEENVIVASNGSEEYRFSPNTTDDEFKNHTQVDVDRENSNG